MLLKEENVPLIIAAVTHTMNIAVRKETLAFLTELLAAHMLNKTVMEYASLALMYAAHQTKKSANTLENV